MAHQKDTDYLALSARIQVMQTRLLNDARIERMLTAKDTQEAAKVLDECGYGALSEMHVASLETLLSDARAQLYADMEKNAPNVAVLDFFRLKYDYHNAKVIVKSQAQGKRAEHLFIPGGRYDAGNMQAEYLEETLLHVSDTFRSAIFSARDILVETADPQKADLALDRGLYEEMKAYGVQSESKYLMEYTVHAIDGANLRSAVRAARLEKDSEFLQGVLIEGGSVSTRQIATANAQELENLYQGGIFAESAAVGATVMYGQDHPLTQFERLCDDALTNFLLSARRVPFGVELLVYYLAARETESVLIRTILAGRMAGLESEEIRPRLRTTFA